MQNRSGLPISRNIALRHNHKRSRQEKICGFGESSGRVVNHRSCIACLEARKQRRRRGEPRDERTSLWQALHALRRY
jgi:hypothetical protein